MMRILLTVLLFGLATSGLAHSPLETTSPLDGAIVVGAPEQITMTFKKGIRLTKVEVSYADQSAAEINLSDQNDFTTSYTLPMAGMGTGTYSVAWRGLSIDGHIMNGSFSFEVE